MTHMFKMHITLIKDSIRYLWTTSTPGRSFSRTEGPRYGASIKFSKTRKKLALESRLIRENTIRK